METNDRLPFGIYVRLTAGQPVCADLISSLSLQKPDLSSTSDGHSGRANGADGAPGRGFIVADSPILSAPVKRCGKRSNAPVKRCRSPVIVSSGQTLRSNGQTLRSNAAGRRSQLLLPLYGSADGWLLMVGAMCLLIYWQGVSGFPTLAI